MSHLTQHLSRCRVSLGVLLVATTLLCACVSRRARDLAWIEVRSQGRTVVTIHVAAGETLDLAAARRAARAYAAEGGEVLIGLHARRTGGRWEVVKTGEALPAAAGPDDDRDLPPSWVVFRMLDGVPLQLELVGVERSFPEDIDDDARFFLDIGQGPGRVSPQGR